MSVQPAVRFRLYVAGESTNSHHATRNLQALCAQYLREEHAIEIVDVTVEPLRALEDRILVTPTLVRLEPEPVVRIIGNLTDTPRVLSALGLG